METHTSRRVNYQSVVCDETSSEEIGALAMSTTIAEGGCNITRLQLDRGLWVLLLLPKDLGNYRIARLKDGDTDTGRISSVVNRCALRLREVMYDPACGERVSITFVYHPERAHMDLEPKLENVEVEYKATPLVLLFANVLH